MILACQNISKSFGVEPVIRNVSFHVEDQEKVAIVGIKGCIFSYRRTGESRYCRNQWRW